MPKKKTAHDTASPQAPGCLPFPVVAVGASAGGLEALEVLLRKLPDRLGAALVVVTHMDPARKSFLAELLGSYTALTVRQAENRLALEADTVSVIPPGKIMHIEGGRLQLSERSRDQAGQHSIDRFFASLAKDQGDNAIGIVLSGTGSDGSEGVRAIKEADGVVLVQSPDTALHPGMPQSAWATGLADALVPIGELAERLGDFLHIIMTAGHAKGRQDQAADDSKLLPRLLGLVQAESGHDLSGYKLSTINRRVHKRMLLSGCKTLKEYVTFVENDQGERAALFHELLIRVTRFFRDPEAFAALRQMLLVPAMQRKAPQDVLRVWVAGCSTGEEAYTLAMLIAEYLEVSRRQCGVKIFATDIDEASIAAARRGVFRGAIARDVPQKLLAKYFMIRGADYIAAPVLREMILFSVHDILRDPPFFRMDLVVCRNLLIYLGGEAQQKVLSLFHATLSPGGGLFLGPSETIAEQQGLFEAVDKKWRIFRQRDTGSRPLHLAPHTIRPVAELPFQRSSELPRAPSDTVGLMDHALAVRYGHPSVLVDAQMRIIRINGEMARFMAIPQGELSSNLYKYVKKPLRLQLRSAIKNATKTRQAVEVRNLRLDTAGDVLLHLVVVPLDAMEGSSGLMLVIFEETRLSALAEGHVINAALTESEVVSQLEDELKTTKDQLQEAVESFEGMNEELRASNEELVSMNEEIQSSYEELETSGEELQALNEELTVMNTELQAKVEELDAANSYLDNLLRSTNVATIFLDRELCILRFTPAASELYHLRAADVRRPITEIVNLVLDLDIQALARDVLASLQMIEREVQTTDGRWFLARIFPYQTVKQEIDGVVLTFVDVTPLKLAEAQLKLLNQELEQRVAVRTQELRQAKELAERHAAELQAVMEQVPAAVWITRDPEARQAVGNRASCDLMRLSEESCGGEAFFGEGEQPTCRTLKEGRELPPSERPLRRAAAGERVVDEELALVFPDGEVRTILGNATPLLDAHGEVCGAVASFIDITRRKKIEAALKESEERFRTLVESAPDAIFVQTRGAFAYVNPAAVTLLGAAAPDELLGTPVADRFHPEVAAIVRERIRRLNDDQLPVLKSEMQYRLRDGIPLQVDVSGVPVVFGGEHGALVFMRDVSERRLAEEARREREEIYRGLFLNEHTVMFLIDPEDGRIKDTNPAASAYYGYSRDELLSMSVAQLNTQTPEQVRALIDAAKGRTQSRFEFQHRLASGEVRDVEVYSGPVRVQGRELLFSLVHDITERIRTQQALEASEARLRLAQEAAQAGTWEWDLTTNENIWSDELWRLYGLAPRSDTPSYDLWLSTVDPDDRQAAAAAVQQAAQSGAELDAEWRVNTPDGAERWLMSRGRPQRDATGAVTRYLGIVLDITARKRAEEAVRESSKRFRDLFESMNEGVCILEMLYDDAGNPEDYLIRDVNPHYETIIGVSRDRAIGARVRELFGIGAPPNADVYRRVVETGEPVNFESPFAPRGLHLQISAYRLQGRQFAIVFQDITERKRIEASLREREEQLRLFVEHAPASIAMFDTDMRYLAVSRRWMTDFGLGDADIIGRSHYEIFPEIPERWKAIHRRCMAGAVETAEADSFVRADGSSQWLHWEVRPWYLDSGAVGGLVFFSEDITERKLAEIALVEAKQQVERTLEDLNFVVEATDLGVWSNDWPLDKLNWNRQVKDHFWLPPDREPDLDEFFAILHPDDREPTRLAIEKAIVERSLLIATYRTVAQDGRIKWIRACGRAIYGADGQPVRFSGITQDVTAVKTTEIALRESQEKLEAALASMSDAVFISDAQGNFIHFNDAFATFHRFASKEQCARTFAAYPDILDVYLDTGELAPIEDWAVPRALRGETATNAEYGLRRKDTGEAWVGSYNFSPIRGKDGGIVGAVIVARDITDRKRAELEIRSLAKFPEENPNPVMRVSPDLVVRYANPASREFLGHFGSEVGRPFPAQFGQSLERALTTMETEDFIADVEGRIYAMIATPIADEGYVNIYGQDITARKHAEEAREGYLAELKAQREFLGSLIDNAPIAIGVVEGPGHRFILTNPAYEAVLSDRQVSIVNRTLREAFPSVAEHVSELFDSVYASGLTVHLREYKVPIGSEITWWDAEYVPLHDTRGKVGRILIIGRDITDTIHAAKALRESEERFRTLFDAMQEGVALHRMVYDEQGRPQDYVILDVNPAFERVLGLSRTAVVGQTSTTAYATDSPPFLDIYAAVAAGDGSRYFEIFFEPLDRTFSISAVSPGPGLFATVFEDITERTRTQQALRQAKDAAEAANRAKGEFLANMSHELRTPLNGVLGMLQLLSEMPMNQEQTLLLRTALESGQGLKAIINDILSFAQIEAGRISINREDCDIREIVGSVCRAFSYEAAAKKLALTCLVEPGVPDRVVSDVVRIRQILVNLIGNALKFTEQGRVEVTVTSLSPQGTGQDHLLLFSVSDTGIGIADDKLTTIFEPFTQADGSLKRKYQGTGIGLSIVRLLVGLMGGTICVASTTGQGSAFHFTIRCGRSASAAGEPAAPNETPATDLTGLKVLLAEDDRINRFATTRFLERLGCRVTTAMDGRQALELLAKNDFDCIIMDIQMPEMNGIEATRAIRNSTALGAKARIPILAMTAHAMSGDREQFLQAGMNGYLAKPVEPDRLHQALAALVAARRGSGEAPSTTSP